MSYMRGDPYIFRSDEGLEIFADGETVTIPFGVAQELAVMLWQEMTDAERTGAMVRVNQRRKGSE